MEIITCHGICRLGFKIIIIIIKMMMKIKMIFSYNFSKFSCLKITVGVAWNAVDNKICKNIRKNQVGWF